MYRIVFYRTAGGRAPVEEFLGELPAKQQNKMAAILEMLAESGPALKRPYADHVRGPLRELRVQFSGNQYRVFHFFVLEDIVVLVHAFAKKTPQLPEREIRTAEERMREYEGRVSRGEVVP